jgi:SAM-dependent methyltransferase
MSEQLEQALRRAMLFLGHVVESAIGQAKKAKVQVGARSGMQPILSVESLLDAGRIKEVIEASTYKVLDKKMPDLKGAMAMEIGEGPASYGQRLLSHGAGLAFSLEIGGASSERQGDVSRGYVIRGNANAMPFEDAKFSYVIARMATPFQGDLVRCLREIGRITLPGGQGVLIDYHPFGLYGRRGHGRLRPAESFVHGVEDYYKLVRTAGLRVLDIGEIFVDDGMRKLFHEHEIQAYRNLKGTPLVMFVYFFKPKRKE